MRVNPKYIQILGDALIPLIGFFWWNWSLYFIVLFYLLDYLSNEVFLHLRSKKVAEFRPQEKSEWLKKSLVSTVVLLSAILLIHFSIAAVIADINFTKELLSFWNYKDMGIEQGYILVPLIALVGFQRYRMEFILPKRFQTLLIKDIWNPHLKAQLTLIGFTAFIIGLSSFVVFTEMVYVLGIVIISSIYQFLTSKTA